ncbi:molybdate transport system permease protein [Paenibacillus sp. UNCCL117]|uniref:molybdate ABC transporter permease subunit n=1 Tax=unclassified Paenibacillus TaxID=185978 RepID=UPI000886DF4A|nr:MULTISPECIES: molybdate ABC transporter permease subunit [unclassified Paenibacillus]SDC15914.1 molybdate transport system permease protein [Paenibacillus sp. cl123]SFW17651.1 molybdate transport system permease protein [Paenibacillus sp. UNCCL117]
MNGTVIDWASFAEPIRLSLQVTLLASLIVFAAGAAAAWGMTRVRFRGQTLLETVMLLPLVLPPTVVGFVLLVLLGRKSAPGIWFEQLFGVSLVFTWYAAVVASAVVAFPLVYQTVKVGFHSVDRDLQDAARSMGANEWQVLRMVTLPLAWRSLRAGYVLGFARALGEFGATLMLAGNIPGRTQTVPTAIYIAVDSGQTTLAWLWCGSIVLISMLLLWIAGKPGR